MNHPADPPVIATTTRGPIAGQRREGLALFRGVPYAQAARWRAPRPIEPWAEVRDARHAGPICPQVPSALDGMIAGGRPEPQDETCLTLNLWTPGLDDARRPVMVWIHGGAFINGSGSMGLYDGRHLARAGDCVVVTINYRLGALGFLNLAALTDGRIPARGNEGLMDMVAALTWVRDNAAAFGGDPGNVTIFGESAGAMAIAALLAAPSARGLFHKAILQSGSAHIGYPVARAARVAEAFSEALGLSPKDVDAWEALPVERVIAATAEVLSHSREGADPRGLGRLPFQPVIDGDFLPEAPFSAIRAGSSRDVPILAGTTLDEWNLFTAMNPDLRGMSEDTWTRFVARRLPAAIHGAVPVHYAQGAPIDRYNALHTDRIFRVPVLRLIEAQGAHAPAFAYHFDWTSPLLGGALGACHALELGFVFGTHGGAPAFFGEGRQAEDIAAAMIGAWTHFARHGRPSVADAGDWRPYDATSRTTMVFGPRIGVKPAPLEGRRQAWDGVADDLIGSAL